MITYDSIKEKLGFDPMKVSNDFFHDYEDDSIPSPYKVLTKEESDFLHDYWISHIKLPYAEKE